MTFNWGKTSVLIAVWLTMSLLSSTCELIKAQMMIGDHGNGNMTSESQEHEPKMAINGSIDLEQIIYQAINSKVKTSLTQAMTIAEKSIGNNSSALAAFGNDRGGYFVYHIILGTPTMKFYNVLVDPGSGQILSTQETSKRDLEQMHLEHSSEVVRGEGGSVGGFPLLIPH